MMTGSPTAARAATTRVADATILVAGVGNLFLGDDGFGPEVARRLAGRALPAGVGVTDYGVGGIHLAYDLLEGPELLVLVDVVERGGQPGTVSVLEVQAAGDDAPPMDAHAMDPQVVLATVRRLGGTVPRTLVVACEPADLGEGMGLSPAVADAVDPTVAALVDLVARELALLDPAQDDPPDPDPPDTDEQREEP